MTSPGRQSFLQSGRALFKRPALPAALLLIAVLLLYSPVTHFSFVQLDDPDYVTQNQHVQTGLNPQNVSWAFRSLEPFYWQPMTWLSLMANRELFGANPGPFHLVNVLLHACNVLLVFLLLYAGTGRMGRSFVVAAIFAVHPLNVESVAWVAERNTVLCTFFSLLTIASYGWYAVKRSGKRYLAVVVGFVLALMSKPSAVTLPIILLLLDFWPLGRFQDVARLPRWLRLIQEKIPLLAMSAATSLLTMRIGAVVGVAILPLHLRIETAITSYASYLRVIFWPLHLAVFYPHPASKLPYGAHLPWAQVLISTFLLVGITAFAWWLRRFPYLLMGWLLFVLTLLPTIGIFQAGMQARADRFTYIPALGIFIAVVYGLSDFVERYSWPKLVSVILPIPVLVALAALTSSYLPNWQNGVVLFEHARAEAGQPDAFIERSLGDALFFSGHPDEGLEHYRLWCQISPKLDLCHFNIAQVLAGQGRLSEALPEYRLAAQYASSPGIALLAHDRAAELLLRLNEYDEAAQEIRAALAIRRDDPMALYLLSQLPRH